MRYIISLGGSLIYPKEIDKEFLKRFKTLIESCVKKGHSFIIFCGGGKLARYFQEAASQVSSISDEQKDWLGIQATKLNAVLVRSLFDDSSVCKKVISDPTEKIPNKKIVVCSGWKPGWSTDFDAVLMAKNTHASVIINMSNIDYVYDKDPGKCKDAKRLKRLSWAELKKLVGDRWKPGMNAPFDPIATSKASEYGLTVLIVGKSLDNLKKVFDGRDFEGTVIR